MSGSVIGLGCGGCGHRRRRRARRGQGDRRRSPASAAFTPVTPAPGVVSRSPTFPTRSTTRSASLLDRPGQPADPPVQPADPDPRRQARPCSTYGGRVLPLLRGRTLGPRRRVVPVRNLLRSQGDRLVPDRRRRRTQHLQLRGRHLHQPVHHLPGGGAGQQHPERPGLLQAARQITKAQQAILNKYEQPPLDPNATAGQFGFPFVDIDNQAIVSGPRTAPASWPARPMARSPTGSPIRAIRPPRPSWPPPTTSAPASAPAPRTSPRRSARVSGVQAAAKSLAELSQIARGAERSAHAALAADHQPGAVASSDWASPSI